MMVVTRTQHFRTEWCTGQVTFLLILEEVELKTMCMAVGTCALCVGLVHSRVRDGCELLLCWELNPGPDQCSKLTNYLTISSGLYLCELKVSLVFKQTPSQKTKTKLFLNPTSGMKVREI